MSVELVRQFGDRNRGGSGGAIITGRRVGGTGGGDAIVHAELDMKMSDGGEYMNQSSSRVRRHTTGWQKRKGKSNMPFVRE